MGGEGSPFGIERTNLKFFRSEYHSQAPLWIALELRKQIAVADIEAIYVQTYFAAWSEIGSEPQKWNPQTRETADHSLVSVGGRTARRAHHGGQLRRGAHV
jgi:2-methylcitrate dehydratase